MANRKERRAKAKKSAKAQKNQTSTVNENIQPDKDQDVLFKLLDAKIEIPIQVLRDKHIFIATSCYGGQIGEPF